MKGKDELILDAIVQFEGIWPDDRATHILLQKDEMLGFKCATLYGNTYFWLGSKTSAYVVNDHCWSIVCTKEEFELRVKEIYDGDESGETHVAIKSSGHISLVYFSFTGDSDTCFHGRNSDGDIFKFSKTCYKLLKLPNLESQPFDHEKDDWNGEGLPPVGVKCEANLRSQPSFVCLPMAVINDEIWFKEIREGKGNRNFIYKISELEFRPLKTEAEKEQESLALQLWRTIHKSSSATDKQILQSGRNFDNCMTAIDDGWRLNK